MKTTTMMYDAVDRYMHERAMARVEYRSTMMRIADAAGTPYYDQIKEEADKKRAARVAAAQDRARAEVKTAVETMVENADRLQMTPPTEDQLRIMELLNMREKLTKGELDAAANAMGGNAAALALLDELAQKHDILSTSYLAQADGSLTPDVCKREIRNAVFFCREIIDDTIGSQPNAVRYANYRAQIYGETPDLDSLEPMPFFDNEESFYEKACAVPYSAFEAAVG